MIGGEARNLLWALNLALAEARMVSFSPQFLYDGGDECFPGVLYLKKGQALVLPIHKPHEGIALHPLWMFVADQFQNGGSEIERPRWRVHPLASHLIRQANKKGDMINLFLADIWKIWWRRPMVRCNY